MERKIRRYAAGLFVVFLVLFIPLFGRAASPSVSVSAKVNYTESSRFLKKLNDLRR